MQVFKELSLVTSFWSVIDHDDNLFACEDHIPNAASMGDSYFGGSDQDYTEWLVSEGALLLKSNDRYTKAQININWVKNLVMAHRGEQSFINYGNECYTDYAYHNVCLIVKVGRPRRRGSPE